MANTNGYQVKEMNWHLLLKEIMLPLSMEKPTALPLTKKEYDRINWTKYCKSNRRIFI